MKGHFKDFQYLFNTNSQILSKKEANTAIFTIYVSVELRQTPHFKYDCFGGPGLNILGILALLYFTLHVDELNTKGPQMETRPQDLF